MLHRGMPHACGRKTPILVLCFHCRMGGPDGIAAAMLDEFAGALQRARSGQASTKVPEAPGFGAEAALAGGLQVAAGLLASSQASHVACAARKVRQL